MVKEIKDTVFIVTVFIAGAATAIYSFHRNTLEAPKLLNCTFTEQIFIQGEGASKWPTGSVSGCRCKIMYDDTIYITYENVDPIACRRK